MKFSPTLSLYLARQFLLWLFIGLGVCSFLIFMVDFVEILRKGSKTELAFGLVLQITVFRFPNLLLQILPFAFLFGSILSFTRLARSRELVVIRSAGVSVWQFLMPSVLASLFIGIFIVVAFNPLSAALNYHAEQMENKYLGGSSSLITVSRSGLWLKQRDANGNNTILTAASISPDSKNFKGITVFNFDNDFDFLYRIDAIEGTLMENEWQFSNLILNAPNRTPQKLDEYKIPTQLTLAQIQDSFGSPDTISFWELPEFIRVLQASGFSALKHSLHFHTILTTPVILIAMVIIASVFSLKFSRRGKTGLLIVGAVLSGFVFYFITRLTASYGIAGNMPIIIAAWAPAGIFILLSLWLILHQEEG